MALLENFISAFILGLLTPLTAVCVLPLYPGFLAYLSNQFTSKVNKKTYALLGLLVTIGVLVFMLSLGLLFTTVFQASLTKIVGIISPFAFGLLGIISIFLILDKDMSRFIPHFKVKGPQKGKPLRSAFFFGFFFGAIVIPCNPGFIAIFFSRTALATNFLSSMTGFLAFGIGLAFPLFVFSLVSANWSTQVIGFLTKHKTAINRIAGIVMLIISVYYLTCVFMVFGSDSAAIQAICKPLGQIFGTYTQLF